MSCAMDEAASNISPSCPECDRLRQRVAQLEATVAQLEQRLGNHSGNSSIPPSANPPHAPRPKPKAPSKRRRGGQPGHQGHSREKVPPGRVDVVVDHVPEACSRCRASLPAGARPNDPQPTWHQVIDLPPSVLVVTEHRGQARTCPACGEVTRAAIPETIAAHVAGPRLTAFLSYLVGRHHASRRGVGELVEALGARLSLGTIGNLEREVASALGTPHAEAADHVRQAEAKNGDETGWKLAGARRWLWAVATTKVAYLLIHARRGRVGLDAAMGQTRIGVMTSDRWGAYGSWPLERRQICWSHLIRDFQKCVDRGGPSESLGRAGLAVARSLFAAWNEFGERSINREELRRRLAPLRQRLRADLEGTRASPDRKVSTFATNLLNLEPALWLFGELDGVEPTNNHAERVLRRGVLWRKNAFGSSSESGCRFAERMLTVVQTLRLQGRPVLDYLTEAVRAHRHGEPAPKLVP
jgi:transposase